MKGGFNNPPNADQTVLLGAVSRASMKGGFNNPPNPARLDVTLHTLALQ